MQVLTFSDPMKPPALLSADHVFSSETELPVDISFETCRGTVGGPLRHGEAGLGTTTRRVGTTVTGNREPTILPQPLHLRNCRCRLEMFQSRRRLLLAGNVTTAIPFRNKKFFRSIQSTLWSTKSGLAGKDIADLRVTELTRKGLDDFSLRCLSNGEFQSLVFVRSISEAVFVSNLLRHIRQDRIDLECCGSQYAWSGSS